MRPHSTRSTRTAPLAAALALLMLGSALAQVPLPTTPPAVVAKVPFRPIATVYAEDFELGTGGFTVGGNGTWQHGVPTAHVQPVAGQGPNVFGTNLAGSYGDYECGWIDSPSVDLGAYPPGAQTGVSAARLLHRQWSHFENLWDGGAVLASRDGETWQMLTPTDGYDGRMIHSFVRGCLGVEIGQLVLTGPSGTTPPAADAWREAEYDLTAFLGGPLHLRWIYGSDHVDTRLGWYVDDVVVQVGAGAFVRMPLPEVADETGVAFQPVHTLYAQDFEVDDGGWTSSGTGAWEWGSPVAPPVPPVGALNVWGTRIAGDYQPNECSFLTSPPIALPGADAGAGVDAARVSFQLWRHLRSGYDAAALQVSTDGGATWRLAQPVDGYDRTITSSSAAVVRDCLGIAATDAVWSGPSTQPRAEEWMSVSADLTPFMGGEVLLRFGFGSGATGVVARGAYVDDVLVQLGAGGSVDPRDPQLPATPTPGWSVSGTAATWEHGLPTTGPASSTPVWATNLDGNHARGECSFLVSDPVNTAAVAGLGRLTLAFEHHFRTAHVYDAGVVQVSRDDGATWTLVTPYAGYPSTLGTSARACLTEGAAGRGYTGSPTGDAYRAEEVNLQSFAGETIRVRFGFSSDTLTESLGWYVRDVQLTRGAVPLPLGLSGAQPRDALHAKADDALRAALGEPRALYDVIVVGQPHEGLAGQRFADRDAALEHVERLAAPFLGGVGDVARASGAEVVDAWATTPAVKLVADLPTLALLAERDDVRHVTMDRDDAVRLVDPIEDDGVSASNTNGRRQIQAEDVWALGYRGEGIRVAVIDTGIDATHEAFRWADGSSRVAGWVDYVGGNPTPYDDHGHGTHVAGTSVGSAHYDHPQFGRFQETGVAPEATLLVAKFLSGSGSGSLENGIKSLNWAFENGADVTSNSWGSSCGSGGVSLMQTVRTLTDLGMLSVFAAGNSGPGSGTINGPACSESPITVGAVDDNLAIASFSSRGPCRDLETGTPSRICPDVVAKGVAVRSAIPRSGATAGDPSGYRTWQGTSMATPHVAGAVALAEQMKRNLTGSGWNTTARAEEEVFKLTAQDLGAAGEDNNFGWGLPQLLSVYALLDSTDEARIVSTFGVSRELVRQGDSTVLAFGVRNLGAAVATGAFKATLTGPDGVETTLTDATVSLALLDGHAYTRTFVVSGDVAPGTYAFRGSFAYSWTNGETGEVVEEVVEHEGTFEVKRVFISVELDGLAARSLPLSPSHVTFTATNTGNEGAQGVVLEFTVPDRYVFLPGEGYDPNAPMTRYADPAPDRMREDRNFGRVTLTFEVGALAEGESFTFTTSLLPTTPGDYRVVSAAKFADGGGRAHSQGHAAVQQVGVFVP